MLEFDEFLDASELVHGASLYLRIVTSDGVHVSLLTAKSKVTPLIYLSIPRLELSAAQLLAKLTKHYSKTVNFGINSAEY